MKEGGPYDKEGGSNEVFKCTGCGSETHHVDGHNGEPVAELCHPGCVTRESDWKHGNHGSLYKKHFDAIFPNAPGAGI